MGRNVERASAAGLLRSRVSGDNHVRPSKPFIRSKNRREQRAVLVDVRNRDLDDARVAPFASDDDDMGVNA